MIRFPDTIPLQPLENALLRQKGISLHVLRLDTIDAYAGGNKLFKLKYNLEEALRQKHTRILTFGGAWSNHLAALGCMRDTMGDSGMEIIAVVRGEEPEIYSDTLQFCKAKGMKLHFIPRELYRRRNDARFIESLLKEFGDFYLLPEGGSNALAVKGCREIGKYIPADADVICCPVGSGGTLAGIVSTLREGQKAIGFAALKNAGYLEEEVTRLFYEGNPGPRSVDFSFELNCAYHFGGFAKVTDELLRFKKAFEQESGFELDYVYTAKMFYGIFDLIEKDTFMPGTQITAAHTGGLQGNKGFEH